MPRHAAGSLVALVVTLALSLLRPAPAASGADWETRVHGRRITCTVSEVHEVDGGAWASFKLEYNFCDGNYWKLDCDRLSTPTGLRHVRAEMRCKHHDEPASGPSEQACDGATYTARMTGRGSDPFPLENSTSDHMKRGYVCRAQFSRMGVSVRPRE